MTTNDPIKADARESVGKKPPHRWEAMCLADDPFDGDYGGSGDSDGVLSDKMVTNRKGGKCSTCGEECEPGTRNRVRVEVYDGEFMRFRWCVHCCFGMAVYDRRPSILDTRIERAMFPDPPPQDKRSEG